MKKTVTLLLGLAIGAVCSQAQNVSINSAVGQDIGNLINNKLVGDGVYVYNVKFNGQVGTIPQEYNQIGTFNTNGWPGLEMREGIVITTGHISCAQGPNNDTAITKPLATVVIDNMLAEISGVDNAQECAVIDFDFVSASDHVQFSYSFASDEYPEFVCTPFNDIFVFYLTGVDPATGVEVTRNIAMIPGTATEENPNGLPVSINTVNSGEPGNRSKEMDSSYHLEFSQYYFDNDFTGTPIDGIQFDGITRKLIASAAVRPCESYHMHISICNVDDIEYESGVFIEQNSFGTPSGSIGLMQSELEVINPGESKTIPLSLAGTNFNQDVITVHFSGTARNGYDFLCTTDDGTMLNDGDSFTLDDQPHSITFSPVPSTDYSEPKSLQVVFISSLCPEYPQLLTHDTMRFIYAEAGFDPAGIDQVGNSGIGIYPNPSTDWVTVQAAEGIRTVRIVDAAGREAIVAKPNGNSKASIDIRALEAGVYTVLVQTASAEHAERLIKQ